MTPFEVKESLASMVLYVDTREQPTKNLEVRIQQTGLPSQRKKLDYGDYSCGCTLPGGELLDFSGRIAIERKMSLDELCLCFGKERPRFEREFERAKADGCRIYLLIEGGSWEKIYAQKYRSLYTPQALVASVNAFRARYNMQLDFCKPESTGKLIKDILYREVKEYLENGCQRDQG